jgi:Uma2 family endonuclease
MDSQITPQETELTQENQLKPELSISWEPLPENFKLPDNNVENNQQSFIVAALTDALGAAGLIKPEMLIASNLALGANVNKQTAFKAADWLYVPKVKLGTEGIFRRSYTPNSQGSPVAVVMELVSEVDRGEYSHLSHYPYGKLYFYREILQVPTYVLYYPYLPMVEVWFLENGRYVLQPSNAEGRFWIPQLELFIGIWPGERLQQNINWLRWWDKTGNLLLWSSEQAEQEKQRAELFASKLHELGIDPHTIS